MNLVYTLLVAFPLGYFLAERRHALTAYLVAGSFLFSFQSVGLLLDYLAHRGRSAFGPFPSDLPIGYSNTEYWGYGMVNLVITTAGIGLIVLGSVVRRRRQRRRTAVDVAAEARV
jgi:hypothetical protein